MLKNKRCISVILSLRRIQDKNFRILHCVLNDQFTATHMALVQELEPQMAGEPPAPRFSEFRKKHLPNFEYFIGKMKSRLHPFGYAQGRLFRL
jgi:hypothetical protein